LDLFADRVLYDPDAPLWAELRPFGLDPKHEVPCEPVVAHESSVGWVMGVLASLPPGAGRISAVSQVVGYRIEENRWVDGVPARKKALEL
jgi:hypothetical protein